MDTPVTPTPTPYQLPPERHTTLKRVAFAVIVLSALVTIAAYGVPFLNKNSDGPKVSSVVIAPIAVAIGTSPASPLYVSAKNSSGLVPLTVTVGGVALSALDSIRGIENSWYYLLSEGTTTPVGNLYQKKSDGSVVQLTHSLTEKYNLSYDSTSGLFAYETLSTTTRQNSGSNPVGDLVVFDPAKNTETVVAKGSNPHLTLGGIGLIFTHGNEIQTLQFGSHATSTLLKLTTDAIYALSPDATQLSVYDPSTQKIDHFQRKDGAPPFKVFSDTLTFKPIALGYVGGYILAGYAIQDGTNSYLHFYRPDLGPKKEVILKNIPNGLLQRIYTYE
ncbi:MAG: hypothetical protein ABIT47_01510 [Candidatus Paceibacterota bacterium]